MSLKLVFFAEKPDPPQDLVKGKVFYNHQQNRPSIEVVWKPLNYEGGSAISYYIVEHNTVKTEWRSAANVTVMRKEYSLQVKKSETSTVRVAAVNKCGVGEPAVITVKFTDKYGIEGFFEYSGPLGEVSQHQGIGYRVYRVGSA